MSFDYGSKRTGIAISDPLQIIASPYKTCGSSNVINFVKNYLQDNKIDVFVVGFPIEFIIPYMFDNGWISYSEKVQTGINV